jgi:oligoendopeptidase F
MNKPMEQYAKTWDLDVFFAGGSRSPQFAAFLDQLERSIEQFAEQLDAGTAVLNEHLLELVQSIMKRIREADSFTACLSAENQADKEAVQLSGRVRTLAASFTSALNRFDAMLAEIKDAEWREWAGSPAAASIIFGLEERRRLAKEKLPPAMESLIGDLSVDGYHGWGELYNTAVGQVRIPYEENGKTLELSAGQAANKLHHPDRAVRKDMFQRWEEAWGKSADYCADALNRLAGFRLQVYKHRGWDEVLKEPLSINRMNPETLNAMWSAIDESKDVFIRYLNRKAKLLGVEKLAWYDLDASIGSAAKEYTYDEGAQLIIEQFRQFSPKLAAFSERAFAERWIEAEDRPGKRPGGFCTSFPVKEQTRIFMTFAGTASNVSTLAHELGHGFHQHVMDDMSALAQEYAMNVAETASTFAEMIIADAALRQASSDEERLALLEDKVQRAVTFFMNIHARFLFETSFYDQRRKGLVGVEQLSSLMESAQKQAYGDALSEYHPLFWASKLHFYITEVPFYNFPYTFGYLFSSGIYAEAQRQSAGFEDKYIALLRDTGSMTVEELAQKHLGVDLTKEDFWRSAVHLAVADTEQFLELTE